MQSILSTKSIYQLLENNGVPIEGHSKRRIVFNNYSVAGGIEYFPLETGLYMLTVDLALKKDCIVLDQVNARLENKYFFFTYLLSPRFNYVTAVKDEGRAINDPCLLTSFSNSGLKLSMKKDSLIKATILVFSEAWLHEQLVSDRSEMEGILFDLFVGNRVTILTKPEILLLKNLNAKEEGLNLLKTKIYVFNLILNSLENRNLHKKKATVVRQINNDSLREVEKKIVDHLYTSMPPIDEMAKEVFMSASTLKRQFKRVFGSNVYEYYLSRKMQLAKNLLEKEHSKVSEVAAELHYENVSHFIKIFKKIHGIQPGKISKTKVPEFIPFSTRSNIILILCLHIFI